MLTYTIIISVAAVIGTVQLPPLFRASQGKEIAVFGVLLLAGTALSIIAAKHISVPTPLNMIVTIYKPVNQLIGFLFG